MMDDTANPSSGRNRARSMRVAAIAIGLVVIVGLVAVVATDRSTQRTSSNLAVRPRAHRKTPTAIATAPTTATRKAAVVTGVLDAWSKVASLPIWANSPAVTSAGPSSSAAPAQALANPNQLGAPLVLLVAAVRPKWIEVYLPERPNESVGWTRSTDVSLIRDPDRIVVSLSARHLELLRGNSIVYQTTVAVGSPESPTPTGHFFVTEVLKVQGVDNPYGPYALGLSGFSNTYTSFDGGPGQIAIHGTNQPWVVGQYASHGCVRLENADITQLALQVEAGTPVDITA